MKIIERFVDRHIACKGRGFINEVGRGVEGAESGLRMYVCLEAGIRGQ